MYSTKTVIDCVCDKTRQAKTPSRTPSTGSNKIEYELDFGNNNIKRDVIPTIIPKILERLHEALASVKSSVDLRRLQRIVDALEEAEQTTDHEELCQFIQASSSLPPQTLDSNNNNLKYCSRVNSIGSACHVPSNYQQVNELHNCTNSDVNYPFDHICHTNRSDEKNLNGENDTQNISENSRLKESCTIIFIAVSFSLLLTGLFVYIFCALTSSLGESILSEIFGCYSSETGICEYIATTYEEYNNFILQRKHCHNLALKINVEHFTDWPAGVSIIASALVKELFISGRFHSKKLIHLISQTPHLETLHLNNFKNVLCSESQLLVPSLNMTAETRTVITRLTFDNFAFPCNDFLTAVNRNITLNKLEEIQFDNGIIDENLNSLEKILESSKNTIKRIRFKNSTINRSLFSSLGYTQFSQVSTLCLDIKDAANSPKLPVSASATQLSKMFPNLNHFSYGKQMISLKELEKIYAFKSLKTLRVSVELPQGQNSFNVAFLSEQFPILESAEIAVRFQKCVRLVGEKDDNIGNSYEGLGSLPEALRANLRIESNCRTKYLY